MASTTSVRPVAAHTTPASVAPSVRDMLRTVERVLLRGGGHQTALYNARAAVLENEVRAFDRAEAHASLNRLTAVGN